MPILQSSWVQFCLKCVLSKNFFWDQLFSPPFSHHNSDSSLSSTLKHLSEYMITHYKVHHKFTQKIKS
jgi:hypothetical protein